jgi:3-phenylpropionate/cinnamic acid dioxygenase small subunit
MNKLDALLVKMEVQEFIHHYASLVDTGNFDGVCELFRHGRIRTRDEQGVERQWVGADEIREVFEATVRTWDGIPRTKHLVTNLSVTVHPGGHGASCRSYYTVLHEPPSGPAHIVISGRYEDEFELIDGSWQLVDRFVHADLFGDLSSHMKQTRQITTRLEEAT